MLAIAGARVIIVNLRNTDNKSESEKGHLSFKTSPQSCEQAKCIVGAEENVA